MYFSLSMRKNSKTGKKKNGAEYRHHDEFAHYIFSDRERAMGFFKGFFPKEVVAFILWETFRIVSGTATDDDLNKSDADFVYMVKAANGRVLRLVIILEHKSAVPQDPWQFHQQLSKYSHLQMERYRKDQLGEVKDERDGEQPKGQEPIPCNILLYHGERPWKVPSLQDYHALEAPMDWFNRFLAGTYFEVFDLNALKNDEVFALYKNQPELTSGFMALKHAWKDINESVHVVFANIKQLRSTSKGRDFFKRMLVYLGWKAEERKKLKTALTTIESKTVKEEAMNAVLDWEREVEAKGEDNTIAIVDALLHKKKSAQQIANDLGLPIEKVMKVKERLSL